VIKDKSNMPTKLSQDLPAKFRQSGFWGAARWLMQYLASVPYEQVIFDVFSRSLEEPLPGVLPRRPLTMRLATEADLPHFRDLVLPSEYQHFARRLAHGRFCFLAFPAENPADLAAYCWAAGQIDPAIDRLSLSLPEGTAYVDDAYTAPAYRRQGIQTVIHLFRLAHLQQLGYKRAILIVDVNNRASGMLAQKLGYHRIGRATFRRVLRTIVAPLTVSLPQDQASDNRKMAPL
jgi:ribosomal protein S18 acetylase RimI-like enzyme